MPPLIPPSGHPAFFMRYTRYDQHIPADLRAVVLDAVSPGRLVVYRDDARQPGAAIAAAAVPQDGYRAQRRCKA